MPWIEKMQPSFARRDRRGRLSLRHLGHLFVITLAVVWCLWLAGDSSDQKVISVYSPVANYSLPVEQRDNRDYVGILEILEPLGTVSSRIDGQNWRLRFNGVEGVFPSNGMRVRVHGRDLGLPARFLLENGRGLVPIDSIVTLLPEFLGIPVVFHSTARRLFIRQQGTTYSAQLGTNPPKLVLNFTSPVNPKIATEPGKLEMTFSRDPVVASGPPSVSFGGGPISSAIFAEGNGAAELTISGSVPLLASFGNDGRTITIAPAPSNPAPVPKTPASTVAASPPPAAAPSVAASATPAQATVPSAVAAPVFAVIDASHGGSETGATFSSTLLEKDVTLAFARQLRQEFQSKGLSAMLLRDGDVFLTPDQRAMSTNAARPALYISLHAAADGKGARIYTAVMSPTIPNTGPFIGWDRAQANSLVVSQAAAASVTAELAKNTAARTMSAALKPLSNIIAPAIAIEVAPRNGDVADLTAADYQQQVAAAAVSGVAAVRDKLEASR